MSRPSVREALIALEVEGLVEVRIGSGIYVRPGQRGSRSATAPTRREAGPFELLRARYVIEAECAALAAKSAKKAQLVAIDDALDEMQREMEAGEHHPLDGDRLFHLRIAEATGNGALVAVVKMLWEERTGALYKQLEQHYDSPGAVEGRHGRAPRGAESDRRAGCRPAHARRCSGTSTRRTSASRSGWDNVAVKSSGGT